MVASMVWLHPTYGRVTSVAAEMGRSRHTYGSLAACRPWRAARASSPRFVLLLSSQHASASSSTPPTPLQQRLAAAGVADWQAFCQPRYSTLASESEVESMAAKIVELCKEGLAASDIERLFQQQSSPGNSDLQQVFSPNVAYLRGLLAVPPPKIEGAVQRLVKRGLDVDDIRQLVSENPDLLVLDLEGPVQQQKLQWAQEQLGWPLAKLLREKLFGRSLLRMASRLAFMRHLALPKPGSLRYIGRDREPVFLAAVSKAAGRDISAAEFAEWVAGWLQTPEGQRWGFKPQKPKQTRQSTG
ncbi:hypothetical protein N2152v2_001495 [Parachlorella kessleri]